MTTFSNAPHRAETAILVGVQTPDVSDADLTEGLDELALLADTAGATVVDRMTQSLGSLQPATYVGSGKVKQIKQQAKDLGADLVIFDDDLSPTQMRNLEREIEAKLVDRSGIILDIFAGRAKTAAAKAQVELAQLEYTRSRLTRAWTHLSRQKGGIGTRGPGETQIETDRRLIGRRIATLKEQLERIERQRETQRKGRETLTRISLVGYTNAGKSTLMNALADESVFAENRLFATLDATTRHVQLDTNKPALLSDTVGFIRKLPHQLVESFKSTLDEVRESDLLLHVVDVSHPRFEDHIRVVNQTLRELGAREKPTLMVFNKVDRLEERGILHQLDTRYENAAFVSALRGIGLERLREATLTLVEADYEERVALLPVVEAKSHAYIHRVAEVMEEETGLATNYMEEQIPVMRLRFRASRKNVDDLDQMLDRFSNLRWQGALGAPGGDGSVESASPVDDEAGQEDG